MKTIFVINPKAGQEKDIDKISKEILEASQRLNADAEVYVTGCPGDAEKYVREYSRDNPSTRFIACGGDGTLGEIVNGAFGAEDVQIGVMPLGTGNDFCRNFPSKELFSKPLAQMLAKPQKCDVIKYTTELEGRIVQRYGINMFNIGFDCNVADMTNEMKTKPFVSGSMAYFLSILSILIKKKGASLLIELDGKTVHKGPLLLTSIANGSFCGGGVKSNPTAVISDGIMDVNIVKNISRLNFLSKLPFYMKGTHIKLKNVEKIISAHKCKKITVTPLSGNMRLCVDGEIFDAGKTEFEVIHNGIAFVVPEKTL